MSWPNTYLRWALLRRRSANASCQPGQQQYQAYPGAAAPGQVSSPLIPLPSALAPSASSSPKCARGHMVQPPASFYSSPP